MIVEILKNEIGVPTGINGVVCPYGIRIRDKHTGIESDGFFEVIDVRYHG